LQADHAVLPRSESRNRRIHRRVREKPAHISRISVTPRPHPPRCDNPAAVRFKT
jgi:hypothetical protein